MHQTTAASLHGAGTDDDNRFVPSDRNNIGRNRNRSMFGELRKSSPARRRNKTTSSQIRVSPTKPSAGSKSPATPSMLRNNISLPPSTLATTDLNTDQTNSKAGGSSSPATANSKIERRASNLGQFFGILSEAKRNKKYMKQFSGRCLVIPHSAFRRWWDVLSLILLLYVALFTPVQIAFYGDRMSMVNWKEWYVIFLIDRIVDVVFIADIILNFRTAWVDASGDIQFDQYTAAKKYAKR
jgi:hypothetical protein